jgi:ElaB/YqjD/DUF883 family membrane-anchored ribosome-binding protein
MKTATKSHSTPHKTVRNVAAHPRAHIKAAASELLHEGKKIANELYEGGLNRVNDAQDTAKEYSDELVKKVKTNPLTSLLIAGGIGFLLSTLLKK